MILILFTNYKLFHVNIMYSNFKHLNLENKPPQFLINLKLLKNPLVHYFNPKTPKLHKSYHPKI